MKAIDSNDGNVSGAISKTVLMFTSHPPYRHGMLIGWAQASSPLPSPALHFYKIGLINDIPGSDTKLHIMNDRDTYS